MRETHGRRPGHGEGKSSGEWILMDYLDFVVHVFTPETRSYYGLERLWGDAPRLAPAAAERRGSRRSPPATACSAPAPYPGPGLPPPARGGAPRRRDAGLRPPHRRDRDRQEPPGAIPSRAQPARAGAV